MTSHYGSTFACPRVRVVWYSDGFHFMSIPSFLSFVFSLPAPSLIFVLSEWPAPAAETAWPPNLFSFFFSAQYSFLSSFFDLLSSSHTSPAGSAYRSTRSPMHQLSPYEHGFGLACFLGCRCWFKWRQDSGESVTLEVSETRKDMGLGIQN